LGSVPMISDISFCSLAPFRLIFQTMLLLLHLSLCWKFVKCFECKLRLEKSLVWPCAQQCDQVAVNAIWPAGRCILVAANCLNSNCFRATNNVDSLLPECSIKVRKWDVWSPLIITKQLKFTFYQKSNLQVIAHVFELWFI